ncbi:unnamed protein product [Prorocentrum cordatum]|uniref:ATP-dependent Clp protease proteolytic subunit n=1 Tax=Prorocentrum cordatum TaxID=2364126 RepID=A0ABN9XJ47_9DINO|nr:unnamed protein product [Polarella glacialis]
MQHIKSPVVTINVGMAASMASFLLASGEKGKRIALPHSRVMLHQAMGGAQGQAEDIKVEAEQILQINRNIVRMYASKTGQDEAKISEDLQRDNFMDAETAKSYGIIDQVIKLQDIGLEKRDAETRRRRGRRRRGRTHPRRRHQRRSRSPPRPTTTSRRSP